MAITEKDVRKSARLARIRLDDSEIPTLVNELGSILSWIDQLQAVPTDGIEPTSSVSGENLALRDDVVSAGNQPELVLKNAPGGAKYGYFVVPKVVE